MSSRADVQHRELADQYLRSRLDVARTGRRHSLCCDSQCQAHPHVRYHHSVPTGQLMLYRYDGGTEIFYRYSWLSSGARQLTSLSSPR